jgi:hypothetical protein
MNIRLHPKTRGSIWLVLFVFLGMILLALFAWKIIRTLHDWNYDPNHGQDTNVIETASALRSQYGVSATIIVPEFNLTLPVEALAYDWYEAVQSSTNLRDWVDSPMDWCEALESVRTNHNLPCQFYRRLLIW